MLIYAYKAYTDNNKYVVTTRIQLYLLITKDTKSNKDIFLIQTTMDKLLKHRNDVAYPDIEMVIELKHLL